MATEVAPAISRRVEPILPGADCDDVVQEAFFKLWLMSPVLTLPDPSSVRRWLTVVAKNKALDVLRKRKTQERHLKEIYEARPTGAGVVPAPMEFDPVKGKELSDDDVELLLLVFEGKDNHEIAELLEISEDAVRQRRHRLKEKLKGSSKCPS